MELIVVENPQEGAKVGFNIINDVMKANEINVLGLATGSTPVEMYKLISESDLDFSDVVSINLDEYIGIGKDHDQSYDYFMRKNLFEAKPFKANYLPDGLETDEAKECDRYNQLIEDNPIDLQILGIGGNGHIGFNEPGASFDSLTEKVALAPSTIEANARFFETKDDVPKFAYSMGIKSIMSAKKIVLFAYGEGKQDAIKGLFEGEITEDLPASALRNHPNVTVVVDKAAAGKLSL
ncbi:glucosamine-6-phosphate deaminase [Erysipelothrix urinaevulpis]|uniref:glucosamine-6-phosphate deaminase n=1 Tax=Erysipelothrix urinaevulpis TaxID=2683717 RepID=UPI001358C5AE|nr:glucosamine-6-phosphate deaminase [Erysipelothrix urinaevulpis]